ncbi:hypothetical protein KFE25_001828 [Diacronema lutheri]|uniref:Uncharacterized protein n=1 Tax=Diacronema lutheri TaxID=2081491 RepID=A0A8J6CAW7_DIALT|nr:hypothetical protein KFE25_001828 [Diacronema lutheri]
MPADGGRPARLLAVGETLCAAALHVVSPPDPRHGGHSPNETTQAARAALAPSAERVFEGHMPPLQRGNSLADARDHAVTQMATAFHEQPRRVAWRLLRKALVARLALLYTRLRDRPPPHAICSRRSDQVPRCVALHARNLYRLLGPTDERDALDAELELLPNTLAAAERETYVASEPLPAQAAAGRQPVLCALCDGQKVNLVARVFEPAPLREPTCLDLWRHDPYGPLDLATPAELGEALKEHDFKLIVIDPGARAGDVRAGRARPRAHLGDHLAGGARAPRRPRARARGA